MMKRKVIVLTTGGTIGHRSEKDGLATLSFDPAGLVSALALPNIDMDFRAVMRKGSMDVAPAEWVIIARAVANALADGPHGVVIAHGTDTMHYTAAALTFMLEGLPAPVVMTGSMIPGGDPGSDALQNLRDAVTVAACADFAEVCVVFAGKIIRGTRARKVHSHAPDAFLSINAPSLGTVSQGRIALNPVKTAPRGGSGPKLAIGLDSNVVLIKLTPNLSADALERQLKGSSGAVLEGTGVGHIRTDLQPVVAAYDKPVVITTQAVHGGERLGAYEADRNILALPNIIPGGDMPSEALLVKLMWALGQGRDVRAFMRMETN